MRFSLTIMLCFSLIYTNIIAIPQPQVASTTQQQSIFATTLSKITDPVSKVIKNVKETVYNGIKNADSWWLQSILVFLLGLLMSLTPCIYPMIPITIGVLQKNSSKSVGFSFLLSLAYTLGTASTFAIFGLIAAMSGQVFSQLLINPLFVMCLVLLLGYLGLSMFGIYELYIPSFLKPKNASTSSHGSLISAFMFGAASGTILSPCLSPGLVLVLSIVAAMGNKLLGFLLLFIFGLGLSVPLLIVGTFSSSLQFLPNAGMWMVEVKKLFGFMLFGMCFYYLSNIMPLWLLYCLIALFCTVMAFYYLRTITRFDSPALKRFKLFIVLILWALAFLSGYQAIKQVIAPKLIEKDTLFSTDYTHAVAQAQTTGKKLFVDLSAPYCSVCKLIDRTVLHNNLVRSALQQFIPVKLANFDTSVEPYTTMHKKYELLGVPAFLLLDAQGNLLKKWGAEVADLKPEEFAQELAKFN